MLIAVIGDVHLGAGFNQGTANVELGVNTRLIDYVDTLLSTIDDIVAKGCTVIVFTGDIFEHRHPTVVQQKFFSHALHYALSKGVTEIHIVVGNHDQQRGSQATTLSYIKELKLPNIHIHDEVGCAEIVEGHQIWANLLFLPYRDRKWFGTESYNEAIERISRDLQFTAKSIENPCPKIIIGHMAIEGTLIDEGYSDLYNENQLFLPKDIFNGFDITLMGHIHEPGVLCKNPYIAYVGSMEKRGAFEAHDKLYALIDIRYDNNKIIPTIEWCKEPCRKIFEIDADFSSLPMGNKLMQSIKDTIDTFSKIHKLAGSIVKISIKLLDEDERFCDPKEINTYIREKYCVFHCLDIVPNILSPRQARDSRITEQIVDSEAFKIFVENTIDGDELKADILHVGFDIIKMLEYSDVAHKD